MPLSFSSKEEYAKKLEELVLIEAECERLSTEMIAEKDVPFEFEECLEIYSRLCLMVPKELQAHIREHVILSVAFKE